MKERTKHYSTRYLVASRFFSVLGLRLAYDSWPTPDFILANIREFPVAFLTKGVRTEANNKNKRQHDRMGFHCDLQYHFRIPPWRDAERLS
jgi:hypothetical protein